MFRYKEYVYAVYKEGSFSTAAEKLYLTQPCLSAMIKKAEEQLGVPIFNRKTKPISLTEYGIQYISYLEKMDDLSCEFEQYLNDVRDLKTGKLFIGTNNVFASFVLPGLIHKYKEFYPNVKVQMTEDNVSHLENALSNGTIDFILDNCPLNTDQFIQHSLGTEHLVWTVHKSFRKGDDLAKSRLTYKDILEKRHLFPDAMPVSVHQLIEIPFIALRTGNDTRYRMDSIFAAAEEMPHVELEVDQLATAYNIACNKLGATLVSDTLIKNGAPTADMDFYALDSSISKRPIYLYYRRSRYISLAMQKFLNVAEDFFHEMR